MRRNQETYPKPLSEAETRKCFLALKSGDQSAREKLIAHNMRLVEYMTNRYTALIDENERFSSCLFGLMKAVDTFDIEKGTKFSSYVEKCIANQLGMALRTQNKFSNEISLNDDTSPEQDGSLSIESKIEDLNADIEEKLFRKESIRQVREIVVALNPLDTKILTLYFGLFGNEPMTQREIGEKLEISRSYASRLYTRALNRFKELKAKLDNGELSSKYKGRKPQSIFNLLQGHNRKTILLAIRSLDEEDLVLMGLRYGENLSHPRTSPLWNKYTSVKFYSQLLPKLKMKVELIEAGKSLFDEPTVVDPKEIKRREDFSKLFNALVQKDFNKAYTLLRSYLEDYKLLEYETLIINLIILSIRNGDDNFTGPMHILSLLPNNYIFDFDKYSEYFYEALLTNLEEAKLYLEIIEAMNKVQELEENVEPLGKALTFAKSQKK